MDRKKIQDIKNKSSWMKYYSDGGNFVRKEKKNIKKIKYRWMKYYNTECERKDWLSL